MPRFLVSSYIYIAFTNSYFDELQKHNNISLIFARNIACRKSLNPPHRGGSIDFTPFMFCGEIRTIPHTLIVYKCLIFTAVENLEYDQSISCSNWFTVPNDLLWQLIHLVPFNGCGL